MWKQNYCPELQSETWLQSWVQRFLPVPKDVKFIKNWYVIFKIQSIKLKNIYCLIEFVGCLLAPSFLQSMMDSENLIYLFQMSRSPLAETLLFHFTFCLTWAQNQLLLTRKHPNLLNSKDSFEHSPLGTLNFAKKLVLMFVQSCDEAFPPFCQTKTFFLGGHIFRKINGKFHGAGRNSWISQSKCGISISCSLIGPRDFPGQLTSFLANLLWVPVWAISF